MVLLTILVLTGCKSETGRQNIQYIRPVEDSAAAAADDIETDDGQWAEDPLIDVGKLPEQEDYDRLRSRDPQDDMERFLMGK